MQTNGQIIINSYQANRSYTTKADLVFNNRFSLQGASKVALCSFDFCCDLDTITRLNNTAYIETSTQSFPVTVANGKYNYVELASAIEAGLVASGAPALFSVSYTGTLFNINSSIPIRFIYGPDSHSDWADMIGMDKRGTYLLLNSSVGVVDISYTRAIYICSDILHEDKNKADVMTNGRNNILEIVYVNPNANLGNDKDIDAPTTNNAHHITERISELKWINLMKLKDYNNIDIKLYDDDGFLLEGSKFNYTLQLLTI